jgi:rare lipoprotein A
VAVALVLAGVAAGCGIGKPKPITPDAGATQEGIASWYGPGFHSRRTANGEVYNQYGLTAAQKTLPHRTRVRVTNLTNGKDVLVRINDRGPFVDDRIIDLSYTAAREIEMIGPGTAPVRVEVLERIAWTSWSCGRNGDCRFESYLLSSVVTVVARGRRIESLSVTSSRFAKIM